MGNKIFEPLNDFVVLIPQESSTSIMLPEGVTLESQIGFVVAVGSGVLRDGMVYPLELDAGDIVLYSKYAGAKVRYDGQEYTILRESDVFVRIVDEDDLQEVEQEQE